MAASFELHGHRGARGLKPENTLPAFEVALDLRVSCLEADLHLTKDGVPVLCHDEEIRASLARVEPGAEVTPPSKNPRVSALTLAEVRKYLVDRNPDPLRFPKQNNEPTPVAKAFAEKHGISVYGIPRIADFFAFVEAYAGELGKQTKKTDDQRERARTVRFNLELKRVPFHPEYIGDEFDGEKPARFEKKVAENITKADVAARTIIQSFDHRAVRAIRQLEPKLTGAVLISSTAPASIAALAEAAEATIYSPDYRFLDARQVRQAHAAKIRVIPYTVNVKEEMERLLDWEVDGIITDFPDRLIPLLQQRHLRY